MDSPQKIGRYEIVAEIGRGAMGTVYRAKDPAMDRVVAVKTLISLALSGDKSTEFRERFFREARAAGGLAHPGIVTVFDVGEHDGLPFLVMEFIDGRSLADTAKEGGRFTIERVCEIGQRVAEALGYAHQRGVVHRDIKPANILITSSAAYGIERPKITDFGVAKLAMASTTVTGQILGTPAFMPPEQFTGAPIDGRADIFSLGVVLYWMATGEQPFPGESITAVSYKVVHTEPVPPRKLNPSIPARLEYIIQKCLAKSPSDRYQKAEELAQNLKNLRGPESETKGPSRPSPENDPDATLVDFQPQKTPVMPPQAPSKQKSRSGGVPAIATLVILAAIVAGAWYFHRGQQRTAQMAVPPAPVAETAAPTPAAAAPASNPVTSEPVQESSKEPPSTSAPAKPPAVPAAKSTSTLSKFVAAVRNIATPDQVDFDPRNLDPKENARLKIDDKRMPRDVDYTVEMNGKTYFQKTASAGKVEDLKLFVPPGVQEFRVTAMNGEVSKDSNTVSLEFKAKKKNTLWVELRAQGAAGKSGIPLALYPDTQIIIGLK